MTTKTITELFNEQDPSDMFFNHEVVTHAYAENFNADAQEVEGWAESQATTSFIAAIAQGFNMTTEEATVIADDFLRRV